MNPSQSPRSFGAKSLALSGLLMACTPVVTAPEEVSGRGDTPSPPIESGDREPAPVEPTCAELIRGVRGAPVAPGLEEYHAALPLILLETKAVPVLYLERPAATKGEAASKLRGRLEQTRSPRLELRRLARELSKDKPLLRQVVLSEGYLFAKEPPLARALVAELKLADLFDEELLHIHGEGGRRQLRRKGGDYLDENGDNETLLLNDRLSLDASGLEHPLHLDLAWVRAETGARLIRPLALDQGLAAVRLFYPSGLAADALLELRDGNTSVVCIDASPQDLSGSAGKDAGFWRWNDDLFEAARLMVEDRPRFDEPRDEPEGVQEDGELRQRWRMAYYKGERTYRYRDEEYHVFNRRGYPVPPQVCIDFIFDTIERATGTWYEKRGRRPRRVEGVLDFNSKKGLLRRQTPSVLAFAANEDSPLLRHDIPANEQAPLRRRERFAAMVAAHGEHIQEGDVLVIHGIREQTMKEHYHAALVLRTDALTGMPTILADNAGWPRIRNLAAVMASAPRRTIKHRLRLDLKWLLERLQSPLAGID